MLPRTSPPPDVLEGLRDPCFDQSDYKRIQEAADGGGRATLPLLALRKGMSF
jgi:hypothetical protein